MSTTPGLTGGIGYFESLVRASLDGISQARHEVRNSVFTPPLGSFALKSLAAGALAGAVGARLSGNRKPSRIAVGGAVGTALGFGAAVVWTSRHFTYSAARSTVQLVNAARDAHWLKTNPIDYA